MINISVSQAGLSYLSLQISTDKSMPTLGRWVLQVCTSVEITSRIPDVLPVYVTDMVV
jgi:hypothetical protein